MSKPFAKQYAKYYDRFYRDKSYNLETAKIRDILWREFPMSNDVLDVACGTGGHAYHMASYFNVYVQDASPDMYALAKKKLGKRVTYLGVKRMETFRTHLRFGAIICLFASIDYATDLKKTLANFHRHLNEGGLVIFDFWNKEIVESSYELVNRLAPVKGVEKISYTTLNKNKQEATVLHFFNEYEEKHKLKYYSIDQVLNTMRGVGFGKVEFSAWTSDMWNILCVGRKNV